MRRPYSRRTMHPTKAAIFAAICHQAHPTVRSVADAAGLASTHTAWVHIRELQQAGLVTQEPGLSGTLRPSVTFHRPTPNLDAFGI